MRAIITSIIDFFYPPFKRLMPLQTFRYAACGGGNTIFGLAIYGAVLLYLGERDVDLGFSVLKQTMVFKSHNVALFLSSVASFLAGFLLNKYLVFVESNLKGRVQLLRYAVSFSVNLVINYFLLRLFVEVMHIHKFIAQLIAIAIVVTFSYVTQKHFTFRSKG